MTKLPEAYGEPETQNVTLHHIGRGDAQAAPPCPAIMVPSLEGQSGKGLLGTQESLFCKGSTWALNKTVSHMAFSATPHQPQ